MDDLPFQGGEGGKVIKGSNLKFKDNGHSQVLLLSVCSSAVLITGHFLINFPTSLTKISY